VGHSVEDPGLIVINPIRPDNAVRIWLLPPPSPPHLPSLFPLLPPSSFLLLSLLFSFSVSSV
jgi:hypothetical protein